MDELAAAAAAGFLSVTWAPKAPLCCEVWLRRRRKKKDREGGPQALFAALLLMLLLFWCVVLLRRGLELRMMPAVIWLNAAQEALQLAQNSANTATRPSCI